MKRLNKIFVNTTVLILDFLYQNHHIQRFWILETIARAPYFAFLSVLHFKESLGLRGDKHLQLMKEHFEQTLNETEHLEYMESLGGSKRRIDRFIAWHLVLIYYWIMVVYYYLSPINAYHLNSEIELHASETYLNYLWLHPSDAKIASIAMDEMNHYIELIRVMNNYSLT